MRGNWRFIVLILAIRSCLIVVSFDNLSLVIVSYKKEYVLKKF